MNQALISDREQDVVNRFSQPYAEQVPVQMAMSADNGPTPLEMSGSTVSQVSTCKYFMIFLVAKASERRHHSDGTADSGK